MEEDFKWRDENGEFVPVSVDDFEWGRMLGEGAYGEVYLCTFKKTGLVVAIKKVFKELAEKAKMTNSLKMELQALKHMNNPFIMKLYSYFEDSLHNYFVLEYCPGGTLDDLKKLKGGKIPIKIARFYIAELIFALIYLKKNRIVHRDIKPENVLLDSNGHIRLTDFSMVKLYKKLNKVALDSNFFQRFNFQYLTCFRAPEILKDKPCSFMTDLWSLAVTLFNLITGKIPFTSPSPYLLFKKIKERRINWVENMDPEAKDFIDKFLQLDPKRRLGHGKGGYRKIKAHPFFGGDFSWKRILKKRKDNRRVNWVFMKGGNFREDFVSKWSEINREDNVDRVSFLKDLVVLDDNDDEAESKDVIIDPFPVKLENSKLSMMKFFLK